MRRAALLLGVALLLASGSAAADDEEAANAAFDRGVELFRARKYRESAESFVRAERLAPRGPTAFNAARAFRSAGDNARAADELSQALFLGNLSDEQRKDATKQLTQLETTLGVLDLEGPKEGRVRIGATDERALPAHVHVLPGSFQIVFRTATSSDEQTTKVAKGEHVTLRMRIAAPAAPAPAPVAAPAPGRAQPVGPQPAPVPPERTVGRVDLFTRRNAGIAGVVLGVVAFGTGVYVGLDGKSTRDRFVAQGSHNGALHDQAESEKIWANVLGVVGVGLAALGTYLLVTPSARQPPSSAARMLTPSKVALRVGAAGLGLAGELP